MLLSNDILSNDWCIVGLFPLLLHGVVIIMYYSLVYPIADFLFVNKICNLSVIAFILDSFLSIANSQVRKLSWSCFFASPSQWGQPRFCPKRFDPNGNRWWMYLICVFFCEYVCFWMNDACSSHSILSKVCCVQWYLSFRNLTTSWESQWERISVLILFGI